jgi:hypothetical protein
MIFYDAHVFPFCLHIRSYIIYVLISIYLTISLSINVHNFIFYQFSTKCINLHYCHILTWLFVYSYPEYQYGFFFFILQIEFLRGRIQKFPNRFDNEITTTTNTRWEATQTVMAAKLTRLVHKIAIQVHLVAENCTICSSRSRRPVLKLLVTPSYSETTVGMMT